MKPSLLLEGFSTQELLNELEARKAIFNVSAMGSGDVAALLGTGTDLASAIEDARKTEDAP